MEMEGKERKKESSGYKKDTVNHKFHKIMLNQSIEKLIQ